MNQKVWTERHIYFHLETKAMIAPNETQDGVVLTVAETVENRDKFNLYLSYQEAIELAKQLISFVGEINYTE